MKHFKSKIIKDRSAVTPVGQSALIETPNLDTRVHTLEDLLAHKNSHVRKAVAQDLGLIYAEMVQAGQMTLSALEGKLDNELMCEAIVRALGRLYLAEVEAGKAVNLTALESLKNEKWSVRLAVAEALGPIYAEMVQAGQLTLTALGVKLDNVLMCEEVVKAFGRIYLAMVRAGQMTLNTFELLLNDVNGSVHIDVAEGLVALYVKMVMSGEMSLTALEVKQNDANRAVRDAAAEALGLIHVATE